MKAWRLGVEEKSGQLSQAPKFHSTFTFNLLILLPSSQTSLRIALQDLFEFPEKAPSTL
jgi:hypothetical protein